MLYATAKPPSFLPDGRPMDLLGIINSTVVLMCNATGAPSPQYVWLKDEIVFDTSSSPSKCVCVCVCACVCAVCMHICNVCVCAYMHVYVHI